MAHCLINWIFPEIDIKDRNVSHTYTHTNIYLILFVHYWKEITLKDIQESKNVQFLYKKVQKTLMSFFLSKTIMYAKTKSLIYQTGI